MINNYNYRYQHYKQYKLLYEMFLFLLGYYCLQKNDINFMEFSMGLYILNYWNNNINSEFNLIEFGPGNGTLLNDILRTTKLNTKFINLANILLIEINRELTKIQKKEIKAFKPKSIKWTTKFISNSKLPNIIYMNEFFDCLPIRQFYKNKIWYEKVIVYKKDDKIFSI